MTVGFYFQVDEDQKTLDFIQYQYNASLECYEMDSYMDLIMDDNLEETQLDQCLQNSSPSVLFTDADTTPFPKVESVTRGETGAIFPGSSSGSNPSLDGSGLLSQVASLPPSLTNSPCSKKPKYCNNGNSSKSQIELAFAQANAASEHGNSKNAKHPHKEGSKAKNLEVERKRRNRIKDGEFQLRALVPNISKVHLINFTPLIIPITCNM